MSNRNEIERIHIPETIDKVMEMAFSFPKTISIVKVDGSMAICPRCRSRYKIKLPTEINDQTVASRDTATRLENPINFKLSFNCPHCMETGTVSECIPYNSEFASMIDNFMTQADPFSFIVDTPIPGTRIMPMLSFDLPMWDAGGIHTVVMQGIPTLIHDPAQIAFNTERCGSSEILDTKDIEYMFQFIGIPYGWSLKIDFNKPRGLKHSISIVEHSVISDIQVSGINSQDLSGDQIYLAHTRHQDNLRNLKSWWDSYFMPKVKASSDGDSDKSGIPDDEDEIDSYDT